MGDVLLTTPIVRALRLGLPHAELHFLVKPAFAEAIAHNPHLSRVHTLQPRLADTVAALNAEGFDYVLDLQKSLRSRRIVWALGRPSATFSKYNFTKWRMTALKQRLAVPHVVSRYGEALRPLGLALDAAGLEFPLLGSPPEALQAFRAQQPGGYLAVALGATYRTKRWPAEQFVKLLNRLDRPVVLLGGAGEVADAGFIEQRLFCPCLNLAGQTDLQGSAHAIAGAHLLLTHDTGLMHLGAALGVRIASLWGNTVPEFGMTPYRAEHRVLEVTGLGCRPCTKLGHGQCPKGHFKCMRDLSPAHVEATLTQAGWL